ncbi:MAG: zf-HC2 domain-containing protein [Pirellulales bacterium]
MTAESREELISAYLDGELSDDERAGVEKWLAESPELRQLHDELRALRSGVQSLTRHQLDHDISGAVLRRAEQSVLRGADPKPVAGAIGPAQSARTTTSWWNRGAGWRRVVWPAIAVAAALVILVYDANRRPAEREVAQAPEQEKSAPSAAGIRDDRAGAADFEAAPAAAKDDNRPPEATLDYRPVEGRRREGMLKDSAKPGAAGPAPESAAGSAARNRALDLPAVQREAASGLVLECTPQYLRAGTFEKLLDEKKIKWRHVAGNESRDKKAAADSDVAAQQVDALSLKIAREQPLRATYVVDASKEQVDEILLELETSVRRIVGAKDEYSLQAEVGRQPKRELFANGRVGGVVITLVAPPQPSSGAAAPADKEP